MAFLGIEGTAHTLGVGIVEADGDRCHILANPRAMLQPDEGGIHPREAAYHHAEKGPDLLRAALDQAGLNPAELEGISFSQGPGLGPCLRIAATMARSLALRYDLPLVGVNHCVAHLEVGRAMTDATDPVLLYASGANTQIIAHLRGKYRVFGETLDIGIGNGLDKFARDNGLPFPGGPKIEQLALTAPDVLHPLPYSVKGMDMSFSGLAIAAQRLVTTGVPLAEVCFSIQETAFAALVEVAERALAHADKNELLLGGGVACNERLQQMARAMAEARGATYHCPPRQVLVDNGAMIAWLGRVQLAARGPTGLAASGVLPYQRTDAVEVNWR
jgi:universal protein Kae1